MARFAFLFIIGGGVLAWLGFQEFRVSQGADAKPVAVEVAAVENGQQPATPFVSLGKHVALYHTAVYSYSKGKYDNSQPNNATPISFCYYPVISQDHTWMKEIVALENQHGGKIPDNVPIPQPRDFMVLVKTNRFRTLGAIPEMVRDEAGLQGLVINRIAALSTEEENLLRQGIPSFNTAKVLIIEEGREPASLAKSLGMAGGGAALILIGIASFFAGGKR